MKKFVAHLWLLLATCAASGQGTVNLVNRVVNVVDAPIFDTDGTTPLAGTAYLAQLYAGPTDTSLLAIGEPLPFRTGQGVGYIDPTAGSTRTIPTVGIGQTAFVRVRVWESAKGSTYEMAQAAGGTHGGSTVFSVVTGGNLSPPAFLTGLQSFNLLVHSPPNIEAPPASRLVALGGDARLEVAATGSPTLAYQWRKGGVDLPGAIQPVLELPNVTFNDAGLYSVRLTNAFGSVVSSDATLTVTVAPVITDVIVEPTPRVGRPLHLEVRVEGASPFAFQWARDGTDLPGATSPVLDQLEAVAGTYRVSVSNAAGKAIRDVVTVSPNFELDVVVVGTGSATATPPGPMLPPGTFVTLRATPGPGYVFAGWFGDLAESDNPASLVMNDHKRVEARFTEAGGTVHFLNRNLGLGLDAPVFDVDGVTRLSGARFVAQLYAGPTPDTLEPIGTPIPFLEAAGAGYIRGEDRSIPSVEPGQPAYVQMRAWEVTAGDSYEAVVATGGPHGSNAPVAMVTGGGGTPPGPPTLTVGFSSFSLELAGPPVISNIIISPSPRVGRPLRLEVIAQGPGPLSYQWLRDNGAIPGATAAVYQSLAAAAGTYGIRVTGPGGIASKTALTISNEFTLELVARAGGIITATPSQPTYFPGAVVSLQATPDAAYAFMGWAGNVAGTNNPTSLVMNGDSRAEALFAATAGTVFFVNRSLVPQLDAPVFDTDGRTRLAGTGYVAQLYAGPSPAVLGPVGRPVSFLTGVDAGYFAGEERSIPGIAPGEPATIQVRAWDVSAGETFEEASAVGGKRGSSATVGLVTGNSGNPPGPPTLPVGLASFALRQGFPPNIVTSPAPASVIAGQSVTLSVVATGSPPLRYQWRKNAIDLGGATNAFLSFAAATSTNAGSYSVRVFNDLGEAVSLPVTLTVLFPPAITELTSPSTVFAGSNVVLAVKATGTSPLAYAWFQGESGDDRQPIGENNPTYTAGNLLVTTTFWVRISNLAGNTNSPGVKVTVVRRPQTISFPPFPVTSLGAGPVALTAVASSGLPVSYGIVSGPGVLVGNTVVPQARGTIVVRASQGGDGFFLPAPGVEQALVVNRGVAVVTLAPLAQTYNGSPRVVGAITQPPGLATVVTYNGSLSPPIGVGAYPITATVADPDYGGSATGTLNVAAAPALVTLTHLDQVFDGSPRRPDASVTPRGLSIRLTFDGSEIVPSAAGEYSVDATVVDPNYSGQASGMFRISASVNLAGRVFNDANSSGIQDPTEGGLSGVTVSLLSTDGSTELRSAKTDRNGNYAFQGIPSGTYYVEDRIPSGYASTTPSLRSVTIQREVVAQVDFGNQAVGTVVGVVFEDVDGDGMRDEVEKGLAGVTLRLTGLAASKTTVTLQDGTYHFATLSPGPYAVEQVDPSGYVSTTPNLRNVSVAPGGAANASFGEQPASTIAGVVFLDVNGNGLREDAEPGMAGVTIRLDGPAGTATVVTTDDGSYLFEDIVPGNYTVESADLAGFFSTTPNRRALTLPSGGSASVSFGDQAAGTISGFVFEDRNGNGLRESDELGLGNVTVRLEASAGPLVAISSGDGAYAFQGISPGSYRIEETDPPGFTSTTPNVRTISVASGGAASAHFGDQAAGTIAGSVFEDSNGNGLRENSEAGIGGVAILLSGPGGDKTTSTSGDGSFLFVGVIPGAYSVTETDPLGFSSTTPNVRAVSVASGASASANFGEQPVRTISGLVFEDQNGNGAADSGEPGIGGVRLVLFRAEDGVPTAETQTLGTGQFAFADVPAGIYLVRQAVPENYTVLQDTQGQAAFASPAAVLDTPVYVVKAVDVALGGAASVNFANNPLGSLTGSVFNDLDGDGNPSPGEPGLGGAQIEVRRVGSGTVTSSVLVAGSGVYVIPNLAIGATYQVRIRPVTGFAASTPIRTVPFQAGAAVVNFALRAAGTISGRVFNDENGDGLRGASEPGIGGVRVSVRRPDTGESIEVPTSGDGSFLVTDLLPGVLWVERTVPPGFVATTASYLTVTLAPGAAASASFGLRSQTVLPPSILSEPADLALAEGTTGLLFIVAAGTAPIEYQWFKNGTALPQATNASLAFAPAQPSDAAEYRVRLRNAVGSAVSRAARVVIPVNESYAEWAVRTLPPDQRLQTQDPDGDRLPNLLEFVLGTNPVLPNPNGLPKLVVVAREGARFLGFEFLTRTAHDTRLFLETSTDLVHWQEVAALTETAGNLTRVVDVVPVGGQPSRYLRLGVVANPVIQ